MKKILVIEGEAETRKYFLECLGTEGFEAIGAENGFVGIQKAQQERPDLIVSETIVPDTDVYDVLRRLRQNPATAIIPLITIGATGEKADIRKAMEMGADDYITKPFTVNQLIKAIAARLEKQLALKQWYISEYKGVTKPSSTEKDRRALTSDPILSQVNQFIEANYRQPISLCDVAKALGYCSAYLTDLVRRKTGKTVNNLIFERRMAAAQVLLLETNDCVNQIAEMVGYQHEGHFFRQFRKYHGTTPHLWRQEQRTNTV